MEINKNYIPEEILDEAQGDPREAFGIIANRHSNSFGVEMKPNSTVRVDIQRTADQIANDIQAGIDNMNA